MHSSYSIAALSEPLIDIEGRTPMTRPSAEANRPGAALLSHEEFGRALDAEASRVNDSGGQLGLILFGLDNLRELYERIGAAGGDALLDHLGNHLARRIRSRDLFGKLDAGEFALLTPGMELSEVTGCAVKLRHLVSAFQFNRIGLIGASFGVTHFLRGETVELLQQRARNALARARAAGGNRVNAVRAEA